MQFKHPELLWALLALLIPVFIHLFQLRRFKKTAFTNVAFLQKVVVNSRKSSTLKKWLLLATRLLLLAALILAFAQPFFANKMALKKQQLTVYIDDSFSMQAKKNNTSLLQSAIQDFIVSVPKDATFNLFTNTKSYKNVTIDDIKNQLLSLKTGAKQIKFEALKLKAKTYFTEQVNSENTFIAISDFQKNMGEITPDSTAAFTTNLIQWLPEKEDNVVIDSAYVSNSGPDNTLLTVLVSTNSDRKQIPVSLHDGDKLIAKSAVTIGENKKGEIAFTIPTNAILNGTLAVDDNGLTYDNTLFLNRNAKEKINALTIGDKEAQFLERIYNDSLYNHTVVSAQNINYSSLVKQHIILLNELAQIPQALETSLKTFIDNGGSVVVIPNVNSDRQNYNPFLRQFGLGSFNDKLVTDKKVTTINFDHPIYKNVFEKRIQNFQFPTIKSYFPVNTSLPTLLSFDDGKPFLYGINGVYVFTAAISEANANFKQSPLIVPTFYEMGLQSLKNPDLYVQIGENTVVDLPIKLADDDIIKVSKTTEEYIPLQQSFANKVSVTFTGNTNMNAGIYAIKDNNKTYQNISFNYKRTESDLSYTALNTASPQIDSSIKNVFQIRNENQSITNYWKWFVIFGIVFLLIEVLIQKFIK